MYKMKLGFTALLVVASLNLFAQGVHEAKKHIHAKKLKTNPMMQGKNLRLQFH